jgi:DNA-binding LytR/AlgR family response regulator
MLTIKDHPKPILMQQEYCSIGFVLLEEIVCIEKEENHTAIYLSDKSKILSREPLHAYMNLLQSYGFFKSNRTSLFNLVHLRRIKDDSLIFKNGIELPLSRRNRTKFLAWMKTTSMTK